MIEIIEIVLLPSQCQQLIKLIKSLMAPRQGVAMKGDELGIILKSVVRPVG